MVGSPLYIVHLGRIKYPAAMAVMEELWAARSQDKSPDTLLLLEHPPVITFGASGGQEDLRTSKDMYAHLGIDLHSTNRGGRATFHGPGQLVIYPVIKLARLDLHDFLWRLEEAALRLLADWQIHASRDDHYPGVWLGTRKIAAVGLAVREGVTTHGLALNVNVDLSYFQWINPCGISDRGVTSMKEELGMQLSMAYIEEAFLAYFGQVFEREIVPGLLPKLSLPVKVGG
jgi:lipoate-protein ligase B